MDAHAVRLTLAAGRRGKEIDPIFGVGRNGFGAEICAAGAPSCVTICESAKSPHWMFYRSPVGQLSHIVAPPAGVHRRQDLPTAYVVNGAVYVVAVDWFRRERSFLTPETQSVVMPAERSLDIDTAVDFAVAEIIMNQVAKPNPGHAI